MKARVVALFVMLAAATAGAGCGSSSRTSTAPANVPRCGVSVAGAEFSVPASGGSGTLAITTARECAWTASSSAAWLTIRGTSSGQGNGSVEYVAASNSEPTTRRAVIELNDQRANVTQAAAECSLQLNDPSEGFSPAGGTGTIQVRASSPLCTWTAASDASWIVIRSGATGTGNGNVTYEVAATTGAPRTGTVLVAGLRFSVTQSQGCSYAVSPLSYAPGPAGGSTAVAVTTAAGCPWTAASNVSWASVTQGAGGTGPGSVEIVVQGNDGSARTGSVLVAGQTVTLTQSGGCSFALDSPSRSFGAQGGTGSVTVESSSGCTWNASSDAPWITFTGPTSGAGRGSVAFAVAPASGPARTGTISVAGAQITVTQSAGCTVAIAPQSQPVTAGGGDVTVSVTAPGGCAWTAVSGASWITVAAGSSGSGDGTVRLTVAATTGAPRTGTVTIAGQTFTIEQGSGCSVSIAPTSASVPAGGGTGSVAVTTQAGCTYTAASSASWLTITSGASGTGSGTVQFSAAATAGGPRSGTLTIGDQTFTVNQGSGCAISIGSTGADAQVSGGAGSVTVNAGEGCAWTASSSASWLVITFGASGTGNGTVQYSAAANAGAPRSATLTIGGQTFTVTQASGCSLSIAPAGGSVPVAGGTGSVTVTAGAGCAWTAATGASWLTITSGASGTGNGTVNFSAAANTGAARTGTLTVAGQTFTVTQASGTPPPACNYAVNLTSPQNVDATGGTRTVTVTTTPGCTWTSSSGVGWITIANGASGNGNGTTEFVIQANTGAARTGTVVVAGQSITVNQAQTAPACTYSLSPTSRDTNRNGNAGQSNFTVNAGAGCAWTATSDVSWITITSGASGVGTGTVTYNVGTNTTNQDRSGTITVGGQKFTVNQGG